MSASVKVVLLVDPDPYARTLLAGHLAEMDIDLREAADGVNALRIVRAGGVALIVSEMYVPAGDEECLIHAIRRDQAHRKIRIVAHTQRATAADREWAMRAGADAYLVKPTRAQRIRYVVGRLLSERPPSSAANITSGAPMIRRDSLEVALREIEGGALAHVSSIVFGRAWWENLTTVEQSGFRRRAKAAHVNLRSDSMLSNHFVEVRGQSRDMVGLSTERPESPYRR
ncbi:MAG TPA: response regulator [Gemmatimonadaceae bacterium]|nr:response regulator [Gemmatimonadaceae bacterium]